MEITGGKIITNEMSARAMGGTELMAHRMVRDIPQDLLEPFQIIHSRVRSLNENKVRILVCHDLPGDPECEHLRNGGWSRFHKIVFVSNWQMQNFIGYYNIPWSRCIVIRNAIEINEDWKDNLDKKSDFNSPIKLIYHTTPHRGLNILYKVFDELSKSYDITLDVYSSFGVYGWEQRDEQYKDLFDLCKNHPKITYHGAVSNEEIRMALVDKHIYAYPSIWPETSCLSMMEAMAAGLFVIHPNYGALFETAGRMTDMYQWDEDLDRHSKIFKTRLKNSFHYVHSGVCPISDGTISQIDYIASYANREFNWSKRIYEWYELFHVLKDLPTKIEAPPSEMFVYRT